MYFKNNTIPTAAINKRNKRVQDKDKETGTKIPKATETARTNTQGRQDRQGHEHRRPRRDGKGKDNHNPRQARTVETQAYVTLAPQSSRVCPLGKALLFNAYGFKNLRQTTTHSCKTPMYTRRSRRHVGRASMTGHQAHRSLKLQQSIRTNPLRRNSPHPFYRESQHLRVEALLEKTFLQFPRRTR